jgi:hypothetical protein
MTTKDEVRSTVETLRTKRALKLALEALEETRNALAWFYDSYPQDVTKKGNELLPHVETVLAAIREALASKSEALASEANHAPTEREQPAPVAEPHKQQEPVAYASDVEFDDETEIIPAEQKGKLGTAGLRIPLYIDPPASKPWVHATTWRGLTDVEWMNIVNKDHAWFGQRPEDVAHEVAKLVEAKLREKNEHREKNT